MANSFWIAPRLFQYSGEFSRYCLTAGIFTQVGWMEHIWHSICAAGSMPTSKSTFWAAVDPSLRQNASPSLSSIIRYAGSGQSRSRHFHPNITGLKSWEITLFELSHYELAQNSPFALPPTVSANLVVHGLSGSTIHDERELGRVSAWVSKDRSFCSSGKHYKKIGGTFCLMFSSGL
jgi:hypothetical protein